MEQFLSYYPLKQGLKLKDFLCLYLFSEPIFILLSIKTRIETADRLPRRYNPS